MANSMTGHFGIVNRVRYAIVLPCVSLTLAALCLWQGSLLYERVLEKYGAFEPLQDSFVWLKYLNYSLNAPAWAVYWQIQRLSSSSSFYFSQNGLFIDWRYLSLVGIMWIYIGYKVDTFHSTKILIKLTVLIERVAYGLIGIVTCYSGLEQRRVLMGEGAPWLTVPVLGFGIVLIVIATFPGKWKWATASLLIFEGGFICYLMILVVRAPVRELYGVIEIALVSFFGLALGIGGGYLALKTVRECFE